MILLQFWLFDDSQWLQPVQGNSTRRENDRGVFIVHITVFSELQYFEWTILVQEITEQENIILSALIHNQGRGHEKSSIVEDCKRPRIAE